MPVIRRDLEEFVCFWNSHPIRKTSGASCPSGRPDDLYDMPQVFGRLYYDSLYTVEPPLKDTWPRLYILHVLLPLYKGHL